MQKITFIVFLLFTSFVRCGEIEKGDDIFIMIPESIQRANLAAEMALVKIGSFDEMKKRSNEMHNAKIKRALLGSAEVPVYVDPM